MVAQVVDESKRDRGGPARSPPVCDSKQRLSLNPMALGPSAPSALHDRPGVHQHAIHLEEQCLAWQAWHRSDLTTGFTPLSQIRKDRVGATFGARDGAAIMIEPVHLHHGTIMTDTAAAINATTLGCSLTCRDVKASIRWYHEVLGFAVSQTFEHEGKVAGAVMTAGQIRIILNQDDGKLGWDRIKGQGIYIQLNVAGAADVDAAAARIKAAGGALLNEPADRPWGARMFQVKDLDGFKLGVSTPLTG
jgi:uncharacterized glyoxalase superfamily protein PhnB